MAPAPEEAAPAQEAVPAAAEPLAEQDAAPTSGEEAAAIVALPHEEVTAAPVEAPAAEPIHEAETCAQEEQHSPAPGTPAGSPLLFPQQDPCCASAVQQGHLPGMQLLHATRLTQI